MAERGPAVGHSTIGHQVLRYAPELHKRILLLGIEGKEALDNRNSSDS